MCLLRRNSVFRGSSSTNEYLFVGCDVSNHTPLYSIPLSGDLFVTSMRQSPVVMGEIRTSTFSKERRELSWPVPTLSHTDPPTAHRSLLECVVREQDLSSPYGARFLTNALESTTMETSLVMDATTLHYLVSLVVSKELTNVAYRCGRTYLYGDLDKEIYPSQVAPDPERVCYDAQVFKMDKRHWKGIKTSSLLEEYDGYGLVLIPTESRDIRTDNRPRMLPHEVRRPDEY
ncbi:hypothetical protein M0R45_009494 [Rubus argutus]|uniref:Uncharacterized protein n=1 Tax=Rubus argutus TaxID=59490 RepID=A0AAW1Y6Q1_RUBAR